MSGADDDDDDDSVSMKMICVMTSRNGVCTVSMNELRMTRYNLSFLTM